MDLYVELHFYVKNVVYFQTELLLTGSNQIIVPTCEISSDDW